MRQATSITNKQRETLFNQLEGWLLECQEKFETDQFAWFKGDIENTYPDFAEYLKNLRRGRGTVLRMKSVKRKGGTGK